MGIKTIEVKSNKDLKDIIKKFITDNNNKNISLENLKIKENQERIDGARFHCLIFDYDGYKFLTMPVVGYVEDDMLGKDEDPFSYLQSLSQGKTLKGVKDINDFLKKLNDVEIFDLLYIDFGKENFYPLSSDIYEWQPDTPENIINKIIEDEDFFDNNIRDFIEWGDSSFKYVAYYRGKCLCNEDYSSVSSISFLLKSSDQVVKIKWIYEPSIGGTISAGGNSKVSDSELLKVYGLSDKIAVSIYKSVLNCSTIQDYILNYVAWHMILEKLKTKSNKKNYENYLVEAFYNILFDSNGFYNTEGKNNTNEVLLDDIKQIDFSKEIEVQTRLNLLLGLYLQSTLIYISDNLSNSNIAKDKFEALNSFKDDFIECLKTVDERFQVLI